MPYKSLKYYNINTIMNKFFQVIDVINFLTFKNLKGFFFIFLSLLITVFLELCSIALIFPVVNFIISQNNTGVSFIDNYISNNNYSLIETLVFFLFLIISVFALRNLSLFYLQRIQVSFAQKISAKWASKLFKGYLELPLLNFLSHNSSVLIRNIKDETKAITTYILDPFLILLLEITMTSSIVIFLLVINPLEITIAIIIFVTLGISLYFFNKKKIMRFSKDRLKLAGESHRLLREGFDSFRETKIFSLGNFFSNKFSKINNEIVKINIKHASINYIPRLVIEFCIVIYFCILIFIFFFEKNDLSSFIPTMALFAIAVFRIYPSFTKILVSIQNIKSFMPSFYVIKNTMNLISDISSPKQNYDLNLFKKFDNFKMVNVNFSYPDKKEKKILKNLNFEISNKEIVGIKGYSGSGKTTFLDIMTNLIKIDEGKIFINGSDFTNLDYLGSNFISYVPQTIHLLDDNVKKNICLKDDYKDETNQYILKLLKIVNLQNIFEEKDLENIHLIGEKGSKLSGGQKQRLGICRALYRKPKILILDEATNSLDKSTEKQIFTNILKNFENISIVIVSHDENLFQNCNHVYELKNSIFQKIQ